MNTLIDGLTTLPSWTVYLVVGLLVLGESAAFLGLVLPGETALLVAGTVAAVGQASLPMVIVVAAAGAIVGDCIGYWIGRSVGPSVRRSRPGRWVGERNWERADSVMRRRGAVSVVTGRWVGVLRALVPAVAGMIAMPFSKYLAYNVIGGIVWATGVSTFGYVAGATLGASTLAHVSVGLMVVTVSTIVLSWLVRRVRRSQVPGGAGHRRTDRQLRLDRPGHRCRRPQPENPTGEATDPRLRSPHRSDEPVEVAYRRHHG